MRLTSLCLGLASALAFSVCGAGVGPLSIDRGTGTVVVAWSGGGQLQSTPSLEGEPTWMTVAGSSPVTVANSGSKMFFRALAGDGSCSSNIVGYVNVNLTAQSLIANPLNGTNNNLSTILPLGDEADGTYILRFNSAIQSFDAPITWFSGFGWDSDPAIHPGEGFFINPTVPITITFVGEVAQGLLSNFLPANSSYQSSIVARQGPLSSSLGFVAEPGDRVSLFNPGMQTYEIYTFDDIDLVWLPSEPILPVGTGFLLEKAGGAANWTQTVNLSGCTGPTLVQYSINVMSGLNLIANQLDRGGNTLNEVFPGVPNGCVLSIYQNASGTWVQSYYNASSNSWIPGHLTLSPGQGAFLQSPTNFNLTVSGNPHVPDTNAVSIPNGVAYLLSSETNELGTYETIVRTIPPLGAKVYQWDPFTQDYVIYTKVAFGSGWSPSVPGAAVGEAVWIAPASGGPVLPPPFIIQQPRDQAVFPGGSATFTVVAAGTEPKTYQWLRNNTALFQQTSSALTLSNIQPQNLGAYRCVVANSAGAITSAVATLKFLQSLPVNLPAGYSLVVNPLFNASPGFPEPPHGTTAQKWITTNQTFGPLFIYDTGLGRWLDENLAPTNFALTFGEGALVNLPAPGSLVFIGVVVTPTLPVALRPGLNLLGAQAPIPAGFAEIVGLPPVNGSVIYRYKPGGDPTLFTHENYRLTYFLNGIWTDNPPPILNIAEAAFFSFVAPVTIISGPVSATNITIGQPVSFSVTVSATPLFEQGPSADLDPPPVHYQWQLNGQNIPGANEATYLIPFANVADSGTYTVAVGNLTGDITSPPAQLTLAVPGFNLTDDFAGQGTVSDSARLLSSQNRNATTEPGEPQHGGKRTGASVWLTWQAPPNPGIMSMSASGSSFDAVLAVYTGADLSTLTLVNADDDGAGYACGLVQFNTQPNVAYRVCVSGLGDGAGDILLGWDFIETSEVLPDFGMQPQDVTVSLGDPTQFSVNVINGPVTYQWFREGVAILNETAATLAIGSATPGDVGHYFVRAANAGRFRDSAIVTLQIETPEPGFPVSGARATAKLFDVLPADAGGVAFKGLRPKFGTVNHGYSGSQTLSSVGGGKDVGEPNHCGVTGGNSIWYVVQADNNGRMYMNTDGSSFNTVLAAYTAPPVITSYAQLAPVNADNNSGLDGLDSRTSFSATSNTIYYTAVDGVGGASGTVKVAFRLVRPLTLTNLVYTSLSGGRFTMKVNGTPNLAAQVQFTTNLSAGVWTTLTNYTAASGGFNFTNNIVGGNTNRFYRAVNIF